MTPKYTLLYLWISACTQSPFLLQNMKTNTETNSQTFIRK